MARLMLLVALLSPAMGVASAHVKSLAAERYGHIPLLIVAPCALSLLAEMLAPAAAATEATTGASASEQLAPAHSRGFGALAAVAYGAALCAATQGHLAVSRQRMSGTSRRTPRRCHQANAQ